MRSLTKFVLYALIASVTISGLLGILAILGGGGDLQGRILATTSTISAASLSSLSCAALWERKRKKVLPVLGVALTVIGGILVIGAVWANVNEQAYWKFTGCVITFAVATSHLSLLSLASLSEKFRLSLIAAYLADYGLASLIAGMILGASPGPFGEKAVGILSIAVASISILTPIFHKLSAASAREGARRRAGDLMCPCCGTGQPYALGEMTCASCRCVFAVKAFPQAQNASSL